MSEGLSIRCRPNAPTGRPEQGYQRIEKPPVAQCIVIPIAVDVTNHSAVIRWQSEARYIAVID
jgi:hypothetical protein